MNIQLVKKYFLVLQDQICQALEKEDGRAKFQEDNWTYENGTGGGRTRVIEDGSVIEKGGVNFSHVQGAKLPEAILKTKPELKGYSFQAMGASLVIHPHSPMVPTSHMNVRFFLAEHPDKKPIWWFGGGFDLTPYYGFKEDCQHWHQESYNACKNFGNALYPELKKQCDDYFYIPHRHETRGIGGLFFDYYKSSSFDEAFRFTQSVGDHYIKAYQPILNKRKKMPFTEAQKDFQLFRRGRYVEFNLLIDRGTHFGLQSGGRTESILMSLPPVTKWKYNFKPEKNSEEEKLYTEFLGKRDWLDGQSPIKKEALIKQ